MQPSGVTTFVRQMVEGFGKHGDDFKLVEIPDLNRSAKDGQLAMVAQNPVGSTRLPSPASHLTSRFSRLTSLPLALSYLRQLGRDVRRVWQVRKQIGRRIIVTNDFGCETLPIALRMAFPFSRIVAISHTHPGQDEAALHPVRRWVEKLCLWSISETLFNSAASRTLWIQKLGVKTIPGKVVYLGTESPDLTLPDDYPPKPVGTVDFLCVARFAPWKGQLNLVRAWALLQGRQPDNLTASSPLPNARLILVGDGPCLDTVRQEAEHAGLGTTVVFMGARPHASGYFNGADVGVLLSSEPEAFGLSLLEAMSRGKPILASRIGGIPEIVVDGETGLLVEPGDCEKTSEYVCQLTASTETRQRLGKRGAKRWSDVFTVDKMIDRYEFYFAGK